MSGESGLRRRLPAGIVDAGFASLATFAVGLAAVSRFDDVNRGVYAVFFTAFLVGTLLSSELIFTPAEVEAVSYPTSERLSLVSQSLRLGIGPTFLGALAVLGAVAVTRSYTDADVLIVLGSTSAIAAVLSPIQDHVRRMLHIAALNWRAAWVSVVQFLVAASSVVVGIVIDVPTAWIPFGALALANVVSLTFALIVTRLSVHDHATGTLRFGVLASRGRWFVLNAAAPALTAFAVVSIIAWVASPEDLGYAESARVVSQPMLVLAAGLTAVLAPRSTRAAMDVDRPTARHTSIVYLGSMALAGIGYVLVVGWDWALNPMAYIVPSAYVLSGLVALTIAANVVASAPFLQNSELAGAHRERTLARISWLSAVVWLMGGLTAWFTGAYARSIGLLAGGAARYAAQARVLGLVYEAKKTPVDAGSLPVAEHGDRDSTTPSPEPASQLD